MACTAFISHSQLYKEALHFSISHRFSLLPCKIKVLKVAAHNVYLICCNVNWMWCNSGSLSLFKEYVLVNMHLTCCHLHLCNLSVLESTQERQLTLKRKQDHSHLKTCCPPDHLVFSGKHLIPLFCLLLTLFWLKHQH